MATRKPAVAPESHGRQFGKRTPKECCLSPLEEWNFIGMSRCQCHAFSSHTGKEPGILIFGTISKKTHNVRVNRARNARPSPRHLLCGRVVVKSGFRQCCRLSSVFPALCLPPRLSASYISHAPAQSQ